MASGFCGESLMWWLENGTLTISGTGAMKNYVLVINGADTPWWDFHNEIKKVIIHDGVTSIGDSAFAGGESLTEIKIPDSVTSIGERAFYFCGNLTEIKIPDGVTSIGDLAFYFCGNLTEIIIPYSVTSIGAGAFLSCKNLKAIIIPDTVTSIGEGTFLGCKSLREITIPDGVTSIGERTFLGCKSLREITIPDGVTSIGEEAFSFCENLKAIKIPASVTEIGEQVFNLCFGLEKIYCKRGTGFESILCEGNNARIIYYDATPPAQVKPPTPSPARKPKPAPVVEKLRWKVEGKTLTVGGVREIKFYRYGELPWVGSVDAIQKIVIEEGVEKISAEAFIECTHLELLTIPASVKTIGDLAFRFCYCGVNNGKNVIWSLDDGVLTFKKNPAAKSAMDFSIGAISWRAVEKNVTGVKVERGITPDKRFFDWLNGLSANVHVSF